MAPIDTSLRTVTTDTQKTGMVTDQLLLLSKEKSEVWKIRKDQCQTCTLFVTMCALLSTLYFRVLTIFIIKREFCF